MKLQITNDEQLYDLKSLISSLEDLTAAIRDYKTILGNEKYYEKMYKRQGAAKEYYRRDLEALKAKVVTEVNFVNAILLSLGMETISVELSNIPN